MPSTAISRLEGVTTSVAVKPACRVATTANITLTGIQTIDGVLLSAGGDGVPPDRVLVWFQTNPIYNGIYNVSSTTWQRAADFDGARDVVQGTLIPVYQGTAYGQKIFQCTTANPIVIGTSSLVFQLIIDTDIAADLASTASDSLGDALIGAQQPFTGALAQTQHDINAKTIWLSDFTGYDATGVTVSDAAFVSAIAALSTVSGGTIKIPVDSYLKLSTALISNYPILFEAAVRGDISSNTNGGGASTAKPIIQWTGVSGGYMYIVGPAIVGDIVCGGGSIGIEWDGNELANTAVMLNNTKFAVFDGKVRNVLYAGVIVNSLSGSVSNFSQLNSIKLEFIYGTAAACRNAIGLLLTGNASTVPATQQQIKSVTGLVYNGALLQIAETDNCLVGFVNASVQSPGTGKAIRIVNAGAQAANHNVFVHVAGPVAFDNGLIGNKILHYVSEAGGISQDAGTSIWDAELTDYITGKTFKSHVKKLREKINLPSSLFIGQGSFSAAQFAAQWQTVTLTNAGTGTVSCVIPSHYDLDNGVLESVEIWLGSNGVSAGNYRLKCDISTSTTNAAGPPVTPEASVTQTVAAGVQYTIQKYTFDLSPDLAYTADDLILLTVTRLATDVLDTNTDAVHFLGARILFKGTGPDSSGSGNYVIPVW